VRVLHLGKFCPPNEGGIELFSYDLLEELNLKGVSADLLCFGRLTRENCYRNFRFFECKMDIRLNSAPLSYDFLYVYKKIVERYDIVHVHSPNPMAELVSLIWQKPTVIHWHSDIVRQKISYLFYQPIQQRALQKAKLVITTSPHYLNSSKQLKHFKNKARVIPSGLNFKRLSLDDKSHQEFSKVEEKVKNKKVVLTIGRLVEYKGFEYLIRAAKFLRDDIIVLIVGQGPKWDYLKKLIKELELSEKVLLLGKVENISIFLKNCDIFCLPSTSRNESFGLVLVEALYFGKPLVTTDVFGSGMSYVNAHEKTGLVVPPKNPEALAQAIHYILFSEGVYSYCQGNALTSFKNFEITQIADKIKDVYKEVLRC